MDLVEGSMSVKTTKKMWDPYAIIKARDLLKLLARSMPVQQALKIMQDDMNCDIIKIKNLVRNRERFIKRRQRLIGPNGCTLKAIELVTDCYILVQGNTVCVMGGFKGLKQVRQIVLDCMNNIHPIYHIKRFMIKRELAKDPAMANENWERFLPQFTKSKRKKPSDASTPTASKSPSTSESSAPVPAPKKKDFTPFPPAQQPRKVDMQMETGEYFLSAEEKENKARAERQAKSAEVKKQQQVQRSSEFQAPAEPSRKRKASSDESVSSVSDVQQMAESIKSKSKKSTQVQVADADQYVVKRRK